VEALRRYSWLDNNNAVVQGINKSVTYKNFTSKFFCDEVAKYKIGNPFKRPASADA
jgi:hypothetical protein